MTTTDPIVTALQNLVDAIDKKWAGETPRRRANAISPLMEEALTHARVLLDAHKESTDDPLSRTDRS